MSEIRTHLSEHSGKSFRIEDILQRKCKKQFSNGTSSESESESSSRESPSEQSLNNNNNKNKMRQKSSTSNNSFNNNNHNLKKSREGNGKSSPYSEESASAGGETPPETNGTSEPPILSPLHCSPSSSFNHLQRQQQHQQHFPINPQYHQHQHHHHHHQLNNNQPASTAIGLFPPNSSTLRPIITGYEWNSSTSSIVDRSAFSMNRIHPMPSQYHHQFPPYLSTGHHHHRHSHFTSMEATPQLWHNPLLSALPFDTSAANVDTFQASACLSRFAYGLNYSHTGRSLHPHHNSFLSAHESKRKGGQIRFTNSQTLELEKAFFEHKYQNAQDRKKLAQKLTLTDRQVKTWFQNRRAKWRKLSTGSKKGDGGGNGGSRNKLDSEGHSTLCSDSRFSSSEDRSDSSRDNNDNDNNGNFNSSDRKSL